MNPDHGIRVTPWRAVAGLMAVVVSGYLAGCGGGGQSSSGSTDTSGGSARNGELQVAITDAEGDFLSYTVDIAAIHLQKRNGTELETIPLAVRVDFAEYTDLSEFFTLNTLPQGTYTQVSLTLNFAQADIQVEDANGTVQSASAVDANGAPLTTLDVAVQLPNDRPLVIRPGVPASLTLDFDLAASNTVLSYDPAVVEVAPLLVVQAALDADREHRARGTLQAVDPAAQSLTLSLQPFQSDRASVGSLTVFSSDTTHYDINGTGYLGSEGLAELATQAAGLPLLVWGQVASSGTFQASRVVAGDSIPWVGRSGVRGVVVARDGLSLTLRGGHAERSNGRAEFHEQITVLLGDQTRISGATLTGELTDSAISIGQQVVATGQLSNDANGNAVLDASQGYVRLLMNQLTGQVVSLQPLVIDLRTINGRDPQHFDFTGTQPDGASNPDAYRIDTGTLALTGVALDEWVRVRGFPSAFGAGEQDFVASTVIDLNTSQRDSGFGAVWPGLGSTTAVVSLDAQSLVLDVSQARTVITRGGASANAASEQTDNAANPGRLAALTLVPQSGVDNRVYTLRVPGEGPLQTFADFADFTEALTAQLNLGYRLKRAAATGQYDADTGTLHTLSASAQLLKRGANGRPEASE